MDAIQKFSEDSDEYAKLKKAADELNARAAINNSDMAYRVETVYFDAGTKMLWTTIIAHDLTQPENSILRSYQALNPKQQHDILYGEEKYADKTLDAIEPPAEIYMLWEAKLPTAAVTINGICQNVNTQETSFIPYDSHDLNKLEKLIQLLKTPVTYHADKELETDREKEFRELTEKLFLKIPKLHDTCYESLITSCTVYVISKNEIYRLYAG